MQHHAPYDANVARDGLSESHALLLAAVPPGPQRVLDLGCAGGYLAAELAARGADVLGVERDEDAAATARARDLAIEIADLEDPAARERIPGDADAVLLGDVLEHLRDPWEVLAWATGRARPGGIVAFSVPNAAHWTMRRHVVRGRFPREDFGLFDRTHLRWLTRADAHALADGAGLAVEHEAFTSAPLPLEARLPVPALRRARHLLAARRPELFALQVVLTCRRR